VEVGTLSLIDLAGSESAAKAGTTGQRRTEGQAINKSLLALCTVISKLAEAETGKGDGGHIPFRDSKLTRLLSTSLGGNARTGVLCAASPAVSNFYETMQTLRFVHLQRALTRPSNSARFVQLTSPPLQGLHSVQR
jgi:centromeric protein E